MDTLLKDIRPTATNKCYLGNYSNSYIFIDSYNPFFNSDVNFTNPTDHILEVNKQDILQIKLRQKFNQELIKIVSVSKDFANKCFDKSLLYLLQISPSKIAFEVTESESFYFSVIKNDFKIYVEEYLDDAEVIATLYKNNIKLKSISGNIISVTNRLQEIINS